MKLTAYAIDGQPFEIRPAPFERPWMDATDQRYAYRCLPLNIANAHGWELLSPAGFSAVWRGDAALDAITIIPDPGCTAPVVSHFGYGVMTFHVPCIFRTEAGYDLMVQGPINRRKDGSHYTEEMQIAPIRSPIERRFRDPKPRQFQIPPHPQSGEQELRLLQPDGGGEERSEGRLPTAFFHEGAAGKSASA